MEDPHPLRGRDVAPFDTLTPWVWVGPYFTTTLTVCNGALFAGGSDVYRTTDGGTSWARRDSGLPIAGVNCLTSSSGILYAGTLYGLYRSVNDGLIWERVDTTLPANPIRTLLVRDSLLLMQDQNGYFRRSITAGRTWNTVGYGLGVVSVDALVLFRESIFAGTSDHIFVSTDDGVTWATSDSGERPVWLTAFAVNSSTLFASSLLHGISTSTDFGASWHRSNSGITDSSVISLSANMGRVFAGTLRGGLYISIDEGHTWKQTNSGWTEATAVASVVLNDWVYVSINGGNTVEGGLYKHPL